MDPLRDGAALPVVLISTSIVYAVHARSERKQSSEKTIATIGSQWRDTLHLPLFLCLQHWQQNSGARTPFSEHRSHVHVFNSKRGMARVVKAQHISAKRIIEYSLVLFSPLPAANSDTADDNEESYGDVLDKCVSLRESSAEDAKGWTASWS